MPQAIIVTGRGIHGIDATIIDAKMEAPGIFHIEQAVIARIAPGLTIPISDQHATLRGGGLEPAFQREVLGIIHLHRGGDKVSTIERKRLSDFTRRIGGATRPGAVVGADAVQGIAFRPPPVNQVGQVGLRHDI